MKSDAGIFAGQRARGEGGSGETSNLREVIFECFLKAPAKSKISGSMSVVKGN